MKISQKILTFTIAMLLFLMVVGNTIIGAFFDNYLRLEEEKQMRAMVKTVERHFQEKMAAQQKLSEPFRILPNGKSRKKK